MSSETPPPHRVLVAGGGVEALPALRDLAGERVALTLLTPESHGRGSTRGPMRGVDTGGARALRSPTPRKSRGTR
jgi:hypothetical protein